MHSPACHSKDQIEDCQNKHIKCFQDLNDFIEKLSGKLRADAELMEAAKLEQYKDDLILTKG